MSVRIECATINWTAFVNEWRTSYHEFTNAQAHSSYNDPIRLKNVDHHHYDSLRILLAEYRIEGLWTDVEVFTISRVWHYLNPWRDSCRGLQSLRDRGFIVAALSNGNVDLLEDLVDFVPLPWNYIFSAEDFNSYKPHSSVYLGACKALKLKPGECAMVAAQLGDLHAAKMCGLQAIYVEREGEESYCDEMVSVEKEMGWVDIWIGLDETAFGGGILEVGRRVRRMVNGNVPH